MSVTFDTRPAITAGFLANLPWVQGIRIFVGDLISEIRAAKAAHRQKTEAYAKKRGLELSRRNLHRELVRAFNTTYAGVIFKNVPDVERMSPDEVRALEGDGDSTLQAIIRELNDRGIEAKNAGDVMDTLQWDRGKLHYAICRCQGDIFPGSEVGARIRNNFS